MREREKERSLSLHNREIHIYAEEKKSYGLNARLAGDVVADDAGDLAALSSAKTTCSCSTHKTNQTHTSIYTQTEREREVLVVVVGSPEAPELGQIRRRVVLLLLGVRYRRGKQRDRQGMDLELGDGHGVRGVGSHVRDVVAIAEVGGSDGSHSLRAGGLRERSAIGCHHERRGKIPGCAWGRTCEGGQGCLLEDERTHEQEQGRE